GVNQVSAQSKECRNLPLLQWNDIRSKYFTMIYPDLYLGIADVGFQIYSEKLDEQYELLNRIFKQDLDLPIMIRIYPSREYYSCLNMYETEIIQEHGFSRIGRREISLVVTTMTLSDVVEGEFFVKGVVGQLSQLFTAQITDEKAPLGLLIGISNYFENNKKSPPPSAPGPSQTWRRIWESDPFQNDTYNTNTQSIVAFLIDVYEWPNFLVFLNNIATSESYTEALSMTYKKDFSTLQKEWGEYYTIFLEGRWQINSIYNYNLQVIEESIKIGAYTKARQKINEITPFLEETGQKTVLDQIDSLMVTATKGETAGLLVKQARQALQFREYETCIDISNQAITLYSELNDQRRIGELQEYKRFAEQILELRAQLDQLLSEINELSYVDSKSKLSLLANQLEFYGDEEGSQRASKMIDKLNQSQLNENNEPIEYLGFGIIFILFIRFLMMFTKRPREVL
ncbi:MAG: hypothetical protein K0B14_17485, partial [Anaerolineaceae bacterium]|nr:hypothetical protein [Anaerolineaceae bacterium]